MWPDDRDLVTELAAAGAAGRERLAAESRPDPAFASALRSQLLQDLVVPAPARTPRTRVTAGDWFRGWRLAPTLAGALLVIAAGAAARTVLVGQEPPPPPTPAISIPAVVVGPLEGAIATPTPTPTPKPTPEPTPKPTAEPTAAPTPGIGVMALTTSGCNGGIVLEWSKVVDERFNHYVTLRNTSASIPAAYPPQGGSSEVSGTFTKDASATSAVDPSAPAGATLHYRALAFDAEDRVIAASPVRSAVAKPVAALGALTATDVEPGTTTFGWAPYPGPGACFSYYKLVASASDPTPSYLEGSTTWAAIGEQAASGVSIEGTTSGTTWYVRLQAIRATSLGKIVVGQTDVLTWTAP